MRKRTKNSRGLSQYVPSALLFLLFEAVAVTLWLTKGNLFYLLNFSYIGYQSQLIQINNRTTIDVVLTEDNTSLEEVVVVGYGVQKKRDIVGAVEPARISPTASAPTRTCRVRCREPSPA